MKFTTCTQKSTAQLSLFLKSSLHASALFNYRPISNVSVFEKITEKAVFNQFIMYLKENDLLDESGIQATIALRLLNSGLIIQCTETGEIA